MPVPTSITDLSTTATSNPPAGSETPQEGDNHLRAAYSFIRAIYDRITDGLQNLTINNLMVNGNTTLGDASSDAVTFNATPVGMVVGGRYTPTLANIANVSSVTNYGTAKYTRVGNNVIVSGMISVTPISGGTALTALSITLPIASAVLSSASDCAGNGTNAAGNTTQISILYDPTVPSKATMTFYALNTATSAIPYVFQYVVA